MKHDDLYAVYEYCNETHAGTGSNFKRISKLSTFEKLQYFTPISEGEYRLLKYDPTLERPEKYDEMP